MARAWDSCFDEAAQSLHSIRRDLGHLDIHILKYVSSEKQAILRSRATTHVWLAAVMERFIKRWLHGVCAEFNALGLKWLDVRLSVFPIACGSELQALSSGVKKDAWEKKLMMFQRVAGNEFASLSSAFVPLDGKTIRPQHFDDIWRIFGFAGASLPGGAHRMILSAVADYRNDLAHGDENPATIGARLSYSDIVRYVAAFEEIVENCIMVSDAYFASRDYLR